MIINRRFRVSRNIKDDPVSRHIAHQTGQLVHNDLSKFQKVRAYFFTCRAKTHGSRAFSLLSEFNRNNVSAFLRHTEQLKVASIVSSFFFPDQISDKSIFKERNRMLDLTPHKQHVTSGHSSKLNLADRPGKHFDDFFSADRFGQDLTDIKNRRLIRIRISAVSSCNDKQCLRMFFTDLPDCLDPRQSRDPGVHNSDVRL